MNTSLCGIASTQYAVCIGCCMSASPDITAVHTGSHILTERFPKVQTFVADSAYKTPNICKKVFDDMCVLSTAYKRPQTRRGGDEWWKYVHDNDYDCVICLEYQLRRYSTTNRNRYREYRSDPKICADCPVSHLCTHSKDCVIRYSDISGRTALVGDARYTSKCQRRYNLREETIARVFADAKRKYAIRYTQYRGLTQATNWVRLKFVAMNLKKLARWKGHALTKFWHSFVFLSIYTQNPVAG